MQLISVQLIKQRFHSLSPCPSPTTSFPLSLFALPIVSVLDNVLLKRLKKDRGEIISVVRGGREDLCSQTEESVDEEEGKKSRKSLQPLESHSAPLAPGQRLSGGVDRETGDLFKHPIWE